MIDVFEKSITNKKVYFFLWLLSILGSWLVIPYTYLSGILPSSVSLLKVFLLGTVQASIMLGLVCWFCSKIIPKTDLQHWPNCAN